MEDISGGKFTTPNKTQKHTIFLNEAGLYKLAFKSNKKEAEEFTDWIAEVVLPSIRKTGSYIMPKKGIEPNELRQIQMEEMKMLNNLEGVDPKLKQAFTDRLKNELSVKAITNDEDKWSRDVVALVKEKLGKTINFTEAAAVGKYIIKKYRKKFNKDPEKSSKFVNGNTRKVNAYTKAEEVYIIGWLDEYYN
jgi:hypothetical protein